jgi:DNA-binding response OmpR family regulator
VAKPFNVRELTARVRAVLRRTHKGVSEPDLLRAADIVLDRTSATVKVGERYVDLTPSEFEILATLMAAQGQVFSRLDLLDRMSGKAYEGYERTIDVHIRNLRSKIERDPKHPRYVETVYGMGYRFATHKAAGS